MQSLEKIQHGEPCLVRLLNFEYGFKIVKNDVIPKTEDMEEKQNMEQKKLLNTYSFTISMVDSLGEPLSGSFTVHRPNMGELLRIGVSEARDLGGMTNVDLETSMLAHIIVTLEVIVDLNPTWWKPREIRDVEVLQAVYGKYLDYLREFQNRVGQKPEDTGSPPTS